MSDGSSSAEEGTVQPIPSDLRSYVTSLKLGGRGKATGASLDLTKAGIAFGRTDTGALVLAHLVMSQADWRGVRTQLNVAAEIKAHCRVWALFPPLRRTANPVDIELYQSWPGNLLFSALARLRRLFRR